MKIEIIRANSSSEIECDEVRVEDGLLYITISGKVVEIWNMRMIVGVVLD